MAGAAVAAEPAKIGVELIGPRHWRLTLVQAQTTDLDAAQLMLAPRAVELCHGEPVRAGHYRFSFNEKVPPPAGKREATVMTLVQDIACGLVDPVVAPVARAPRRNDDDATAFGLAMAKRYFAARDGGDVARVIAMASPDSGIAAAMAADAPAANRNLGDAVGTPRYKVTIYRDPPNAPGPGLYIAIDFALAYTKAPAVCGYIIVHEPSGGQAVISREERGVLDVGTARKIDPANLAAVREKLLCNVP